MKTRINKKHIVDFPGLTQLEIDAILDGVFDSQEEELSEKLVKALAAIMQTVAANQEATAKALEEIVRKLPDNKVILDSVAKQNATVIAAVNQVAKKLGEISSEAPVVNMPEINIPEQKEWKEIKAVRDKSGVIEKLVKTH